MVKKALRKKRPKIPSQNLATAREPVSNFEKSFLIAVIAILIILALSLLVLFSGQFVGKAFFTGQVNSAGTELVSPAYENQPFSLKVRANTGSTETHMVSFTMILPVGVTCVDVSGIQNLLTDWLMFGNNCVEGIPGDKITFTYVAITTPKKSGTFDVAQINFNGLPQGSYTFDIDPFQAFDSSSQNIITTIEDPTVVVGAASDCGNTIVEPAEECDDGNTNNNDACTNQCQDSACGDGFTHAGVEQCDDGNTANGDGCSAACTSELSALCGDNICSVQSESTSSCPQDCGQVCPTNGLVSWWKGENNAQDSFKNNYHGTLLGDAAYTTGRVGKAFKFDGIDDLLDLGAMSGTLFADPTNSSLSVSFWVKTSAIKSPQGALYILDSGAGTDGRRGFYCNTAQGVLSCAVRQSSKIYQVSAANMIPLNSWKHVALTFDNNDKQLKLYVDGALSKTGTENSVEMSFVSPQAVIGASNTKSLLFNGTLDEVAVWNRALSAAEVESLFDSGATGMCSISLVECGNNDVEAGEDCDDGNLNDGDGCSSTCTTEAAICGDNVCEIKFESTVSCVQDCGQVCPTNGLVSWWKGEADGQDSYDGHDGLLGGNAQITSGKVGNAFYFDGEGDYLNLGQKPGTIFADPTGSSLSVSFWMRTNTTKSPGGALYIIDSGAGTADRRGFYCSTNQGVLNCAIKHATTIYQVSATNAVPLGAWKHVTLTFDQAQEQLKLYVDGTLSASGTKAALSSSYYPVPSSVIGATNLQTLSFNGTLDEVVVWNRALTSSEASAIFNTGSIGMCAVPASTCGNGFIEASEQCDDGINNADNKACKSDCTANICGDGIVRTGVEQCDGLSFAGASCSSLGFGNGTLSCTTSCGFNTAACTALPAPPAPPVNVSFSINGTKISLGEVVPANNTFTTKVTALESFNQKIYLYTILYDGEGKVLELESDEISGGMNAGDSGLVTASYTQNSVKKKLVIVYDVESDPEVYAQLEEEY